MAKITRIKASDPKKSDDTPRNVPKKAKNTPIKAKSAAPKAAKVVSDDTSNKMPKIGQKTTKSAKKPFILIRPIVYFGRYIRDSWREIRQVRWPSRKATWKLFLAILVYTLLFVAVIMLLDALFTWLFETVIS